MSGYTALILALQVFAGVGVGILIIALVELYLYSQQPIKETENDQDR